jgi:hypothetical protein
MEPGAGCACLVGMWFILGREELCDLAITDTLVTNVNVASAQKHHFLSAVRSNATLKILRLGTKETCWFLRH